MATSLPPHPSLENLKKRAKTLKKRWTAGDSDAHRRVRAAHPRYSATTDQDLRQSKPKLTDCQLVIAREYGFDSWPQLRVAVQAADETLPDRFVALACLCYNDPHYDHRQFHARAHEMLAQHRWLASADIWCAAAAGNAATVRDLLDENPELVNLAGPYGWAPLLCACYSRVEPIDASHSTFEAAKLLLARGADPNAHVLKRNRDERLDQTPQRFTALTGMFGGGDTGMANQPPHPRWRDLAELLLERGADAADAMAVEIHQDRERTAQKLEILLRHGLTADATTQHAQSGNITLLGRALNRAAYVGDMDSVKLLLAHGARTDEPLDGRTPWQQAMQNGHVEIARVLEQAGAAAATMSDVERFTTACLAGEEQTARAMLVNDPDLRSRAPQDIVRRAVGTGRKESLNLVLDLGFDPNWQDDNAAIHSVKPGDEELLRILMARGASAALRDPWYDGTAVEWANFADYQNLRDWLLDEAPLCLLDALEYDRLDRVADVLKRDPDSIERPFAQELTREPKPEDWHTPLTRMVDRGKAEAVRVLLHHGANASARHPDGRTLLEVARDKGFTEIAALLDAKSVSGSGSGSVPDPEPDPRPSNSQ